MVPGHYGTFAFVYEVDRCAPFLEICPGFAAPHTPQVRVLEDERSPEVVVPIWSPHLNLRTLFSSVTTCESTYCGHPGYAERNVSFYEISTTIKVNTGLPNFYVWHGIAERSKLSYTQSA